MRKNKKQKNRNFQKGELHAGYDKAKPNYLVHAWLKIQGEQVQIM